MLKSTLLTIAILIPSASFASEAPPDPADQAVSEYLQLRHEGKAHAAAFSAVRSKFHISEDEFEKAAGRLATEGYSRDDEREPSSKK